MEPILTIILLTLFGQSLFAQVSLSEEHNSLIMQGDTLFCKGQQSRRAYQIYDRMRPQLRYPFAFGDSISGQYSYA